MAGGPAYRPIDLRCIGHLGPFNMYKRFCEEEEVELTAAYVHMALNRDVVILFYQKTASKRRGPINKVLIN